MHRTGTSLYAHRFQNQNRATQLLCSQQIHPTGLRRGQVWLTTDSGKVPGNHLLPLSEAHYPNQ